MLVIQRFCAVSMVALIFLAFCCCPVIAVELDTHTATGQSESNLDMLKEKIKAGCEKIKEGNYTYDIKMKTGSTVHHIVETLSYNNLSDEFEITREVDEYLSVSPEDGANLSPNTFITILKNGKKIADFLCDAYSYVTGAWKIKDIAGNIYDEVTGEKQNEFNIHTVSTSLVYDTDHGYWTLVRHTHYTNEEVEIILAVGDIIIAVAFTCFFTILGCGGGGVAGLYMGVTATAILADAINSKRNADGTLDTWDVLNRFRSWTDENTPPTLSDWCGEDNFKKTGMWQILQNAKIAGKRWAGYDVFYGKLAPKDEEGEKYRGSTANSNHAPVYVG